MLSRISCCRFDSLGFVRLVSACKYTVCTLCMMVRFIGQIMTHDRYRLERGLLSNPNGQNAVI